MSDVLVSRCTVSINTVQETDLKNFNEGDRELAAPVNLMHKTGFIQKTARYTFTMDRAVNAAGSPIDYDTLKDATVVVERDGGSRVLYSGVRTMMIASGGIDGENEEVQTITFGAASRTVE
jgi:hypothetical protein